MPKWFLVVIAAAALVASFGLAFGLRYEIGSVHLADGVAVVLDRWTGEVWHVDKAIGALRMGRVH